MIMHSIVFAVIHFITERLCNICLASHATNTPSEMRSPFMTMSASTVSSNACVGTASGARRCRKSLRTADGR